MCEARAFSICNVVKNEDLQVLARSTTVVEAAGCDVFVREGEPAGYFFNITAGAVKVFKLLPNGRRGVVGFLFEGDFLGLAGERYAFSAEALTPVRLCRFPRRRFCDLLDRLPAMERELLGRASDELKAAQDQMLLLGRKSAKERVASFLLNLSSRNERLGLPGNPVRLPMTRTDIADYLGLTTETVSRTLTSFRNEGHIRLAEASVVQLTDRPGLRALAIAH